MLNDIHRCLVAVVAVSNHANPDVGDVVNEALNCVL